MDREDIIRMARGAGLLITTAYGDKPELARFFQAAYAAGAAAEREKLAAWMMRQGYATGHGDTVEDLLKELEWQIAEREREACAKVCEDIPLPKDSKALTHGPTIERCAAAIRART
jgi:hypothetical protein